MEEDSSPLSRLFEGTCPASGTSLSTSIPCQAVDTHVTHTAELLRSDSAVSEVCIVRMDLSSHKDASFAFVVLRPEAQQIKGIDDVLMKKCISELHGYLVPTCIHLVSSLPADSDDSGLKATALRLYAEKTTVGPRSLIESQIESIWREQLGSATTVSINASFFDLGGDSLKVWEGFMRLPFRSDGARCQLCIADNANYLSLKILSVYHSQCSSRISHKASNIL